ncbi:MAG: hypothetical protein ABEH47_02380 [Haloferacaceae archaeon]
MLDRRSFLRGASLAFAVPAAGVVGSRLLERSGREWTRVATPTSNTLHAVADAATGPFAAGGGGVLLERTDSGWRTALGDGPGGNGNNLTALGTTADGNEVWMAGASGALGAYDVQSSDLVDRSAPDDVTGEFTALAVTGSAGDANVYLGDASGTLHVSFDGGRPNTWRHLTPGTGATIHSLDCYDARAGVLVDGNKAVYRTADGVTWERIGIEDADGSLYAVDATGPDDVWTVGASIYSRTDDGWTSPDLSHGSLQDVGVCPCGCVHAVGASGTIIHRHGHGDGDWRTSSPTGENLHGVALGRPHVAVGASGTVLEREAGHEHR